MEVSESEPESDLENPDDDCMLDEITEQISASEEDTPASSKRSTRKRKATSKVAGNQVTNLNEPRSASC